MALTIAGHDTSSGAGITADLQVFASHGIYGTSVISALTAQSTLGVAAISPVSASFFRRALDHLHADLPPMGVKIGMLATSELVQETTRYLQGLSRENRKPKIPCILDPVLRSSSGVDLLDESGVRELKSVLLRWVDWITPNWSELAILSGKTVKSLREAELAATVLGQRYPQLYVVVTGGDQDEPIDLLRLPSGKFHHFPGEHIKSMATHGTGCAFSSALLSKIILGISPVNAVREAKSYVAEAIRSAAVLGHGRGPLNLLWPLSSL